MKLRKPDVETKMRTSSRTVLVVVAVTACVAVTTGNAQSFSSPGTSWSSSWSYSSATDRSVGLATAQAIFAARIDPVAPITNVYNATNTTSSVGSMNTGSTTVTVNGDGNTVNSSAGANTAGCVDGSLSTSLIRDVGAFPLGPIDLTFLDLPPAGSCQ